MDRHCPACPGNPYSFSRKMDHPHKRMMTALCLKASAEPKLGGPLSRTMTDEWGV
jgi:hypothetical protein